MTCASFFIKKGQVSAREFLPQQIYIIGLPTKSQEMKCASRSVLTEI
ncbi:hypothetical protein HMPREF1992_02336 [Selenomonas sp. oral taxon 892 str. F0426]|nr:hypothetical protein HMPREF1992_02336 [Selenomonas sp. oral taxon 892 str. F0426]